MHHPRGSRYAKQFRDDPQDISEPLSKNFPCERRALAGVMALQKETPGCFQPRAPFRGLLEAMTRVRWQGGRRPITIRWMPTGPNMFNGLEAILQGSNGDHEIAAARTQHPRQHRIIRVRKVLRARTPLLSRNVGVQNLNRVRKVGDQHPDLLRCLFRRNATLGSELMMMLHFIAPDCPSWTQARSNGAVWQSDQQGRCRQERDGTKEVPGGAAGCDANVSRGQRSPTARVQFFRKC